MKKLILLAMIICGTNAMTMAKQCNWIATSGDWNNASNWENAKVPTINDSVVFSGDKIDTIYIKSKAVAKSITVAEDATLTINLKSTNLTVAEDIVIKGGTFLGGGGKSVIEVGRNFIYTANHFLASGSTVVLKGDGILSGGRYNKLIMAFKDKTIELDGSIYPRSVSLQGGTLQSVKGGIKFYSDKPVLKGFDTSVTQINYIAFQPGRVCEINLPNIKTDSSINFECNHVKVNYVVTGKLEVAQGIKVFGNDNGLPTLVLNGGEIATKSIDLGLRNRSRGGVLKIISGKITVDEAVSVCNGESSTKIPETGYESLVIK